MAIARGSVWVLILAAGLGCGSQAGTQSSTSQTGTGSSTSKPAPVTVTDRDSGGSVQLTVGQELIVRLPGNPSTGYAWTPVEAPGAVLDAGPSNFEQDESAGNPPPVGAGGTEVWYFTAVAAGQQDLKLVYSRHWETGVPPAQTVSYAVTVK